MLPKRQKKQQRKYKNNLKKDLNLPYRFQQIEQDKTNQINNIFEVSLSAKDALAVTNKNNRK
jgi:hypothetical protein